MIHSVRVINEDNESITMILSQPEESGFIIKSIDGLGPVKATINKNTLATSDGSIFNSARLTDRNIVLELLYDNTRDSIENVRLKSYKYFPVKKPIKFQVFTDSREVEIEGWVESNEPKIFSEKEGAQVSIICPDPYFKSQQTQVTTFYGVDPEFEFEFENESLTEPLLEMGAIEQSRAKTVYYVGDTEVGVTIRLHATGSVTGITIYNTTTREIMRINTTTLAQMTGQGITDGDDIVISTVRGNKSITLVRGGEDTNILNCLDRDTNWFTLTKGDNVFTYTATTGVGNLHFKIENQVLYEGV